MSAALSVLYSQYSSLNHRKKEFIDRVVIKFLRKLEDKELPVVEFQGARKLPLGALHAIKGCIGYQNGWKLTHSQAITWAKLSLLVSLRLLGSAVRSILLLLPTCFTTSGQSSENCALPTELKWLLGKIARVLCLSNNVAIESFLVATVDGQELLPALCHLWLASAIHRNSQNFSVLLWTWANPTATSRQII